MAKLCLFFGGNGFMGSETVKTILQRSGRLSRKYESEVGKDCGHETNFSSDGSISAEESVNSRLLSPEQQAANTMEWNIVVANRGRSWDWDKKETIMPFVKCMKCDRKKPLSTSKEFEEYVRQIDFIDAVVDFSGYKAFAVHEAVSLLMGKVGIYIYVSSDSIYEVCDKLHTEPTRESDAVRPSCEKEQKKMNRLDSYGHKKLQSEEVLLSAYHQTNFPVVILRLADVVGERDCTHRWWQYHLWLQLADIMNRPIRISSEGDKNLISVVYSKDVAEIIYNLIEWDPEERKKLSGECFNLASREKFTVKSLLVDMARVLNIDKLSFKCTKNAPHIYPSVDRGPLDTSKAETLLNWKPTSWKVVCNSVCKFYQDISNKKGYNDEKEECIDSMLEDLDETDYADVMKKQIQQLLNL